MRWSEHEAICLLTALALQSCSIGAAAVQRSRCVNGHGEAKNGQEKDVRTQLAHTDNVTLA